MPTPNLKLVKPVREASAISDEDVAELARINDTITLMINIRDEYRNALILKKANGAAIKTVNWDFNNGEPRRVLVARAAGK